MKQMQWGPVRVAREPGYGFLRLHPVPDEKRLQRFYESKYYEIIRSGKRGQDLKRLMEGGPAARMERGWLEKTLYADVRSVLEGAIPARKGRRRRVMDIGCGTGDFLEFMRKTGWSVSGVDLSPAAARAARRKGIEVMSQPLEELLRSGRVRKGSYEAVTLFHVLEHLPKPVEFLRMARHLLSPGGVLVVQVPNDFNRFQLSVTNGSKAKPWWVVSPDHINYFSFSSLRALFRRIGLQTAREQGDFPMELFLLLGEEFNYVGRPEIGRRCHEGRIRFDTTVPEDLRRPLYESLARLGLGRNCLIFGRKGNSG